MSWKRIIILLNSLAKKRYSNTYTKPAKNANIVVVFYTL